ncbi:hypothetical protein [Burkholderia gladioli]|uniref:hypothetical protein n=1 Tax=Burkholderia gladioli TaxID=28095 RepID=UPI003015EF8E
MLHLVEHLLQHLDRAGDALQGVLQFAPLLLKLSQLLLARLVALLKFAETARDWTGPR